jgi:hypothetical protein
VDPGLAVGGRKMGRLPVPMTLWKWDYGHRVSWGIWCLVAVLLTKTPSGGVDDAAAYSFSVSVPQPADVAPQTTAPVGVALADVALAKVGLADVAPADVAGLIPMLRRIVGARVGGHPAAEDLVQETLVRVLAATPKAWTAHGSTGRCASMWRWATAFGPTTW